MAWEVYRTGKLSDAQILDLFDELRGVFGERGLSLYVAGMVVEETDDTVAFLRKTSGAAISRVDYVAADRSIRVAFRRGEGSDATNMDSIRSPSAYFDEVGVSPREQGAGGTPSLQNLIRCIEIVKRHLRFDKQPTIDRAGKNATELLQAQFVQLSDLFSQRTVALEARAAELEGLYAERLSELDRARHDMEVAIAEKEVASAAKVSEREAELEARTKVLDDRDHMHVRRDLRQSITAAVKARLKQSMVPVAAGRMRWGVFAISLVAAALFSAFAWSELTTYNQVMIAAAAAERSASIDLSVWIVLARGAIASVISLGFVVFAITWLRRMYQEDVQLHREFERFAYDIDRASWAIETIMEASAVSGGAGLPPAWVEGVTKNLFESSRHNPEEATTDALATLLNASAKAELGPSGAKFELNGNGAKKLAKQLEN